jgi:hypothetical protein
MTNRAHRQEAPMDQATRALLAAIEEALESGPEIQRYRVASALHLLLMPDTTATTAWAVEFIRNPPREEVSAMADPEEDYQPPEYDKRGES